MKYLLQSQNITKKYDKYIALDNVSMHIPQGSIFGLLGPNGAGKTTFIRLINQIIYPDSGVIIFNGEPLQPKHIKDIGYMPEERGLYKSMKVGEQAIYLAQLKGLSYFEAKKQLQFWFERLQIEGWWNKKIQELSKGMAQKIQFIVTVLHRPKLLIFDEPFSGFDPISANLIKNEILYLRDQGATIIFSTHRMESVEELCDNIALIYKSRKIIDGKLTDIKKAFKTNEFQVGLIASDFEKVKSELNQNYQYTLTEFNSIYNDLKINVKLKDGQTSNQLLSFLMSKGEVVHFSEVIPSANDIFIQAIKNQSL